MANKLIKRRYNNLLTGRNHYFKFGDFLFKPDDNGTVTNRSLGNLSTLGSGLLSAAGAAAGQIGGGLIGGGLQSGAGSALQGLSDIAATIPGPWGTVASAGLGVLGGLTNRTFGSKMNTENIAKVEANINNLNNFQSNASDYDTLAQNWASSPVGMTFSDSFIGKDGWFSNKAKNKAADLRNQIALGNTWVQNSLNNNAMNIGTTQMQNLLANYAAFGGYLMTHGANFNTGLTLVGNGGTHEQNPLEGVPMGVDAEGIPNLVEEGEVIFNDYVFSNRLKVPKAVRKKYKLRGTKPLTFADAAIQMSKESEERPNDPISRAGLEDSMAKLMSVQEQIREKKGERQFARGGYLFENGGNPVLVDYLDSLLRFDAPFTRSNQSTILPYDPSTSGIVRAPITPPVLPSVSLAKRPEVSINRMNTSINHVNNIIRQRAAEKKAQEYALQPTWIRYTPAFASGIMSVTDALGLTNKPDYSEADAIFDAARNAGTYQPIKANPISNYLTYNPFDRDYYINKANAAANASRRTLMNTSGGNRATAMAGILAADNNYINQLGDLARQAEEYNFAQRQKVEDFNRGTNTFNAENALKADLANQEALLKSSDAYLKGALAAAELRQKERAQATATRSANLSNFINSLGDIGRENFAMNQINTNKALYYGINNRGESEYNRAAKGGYLTIRNKRRKR